MNLSKILLILNTVKYLKFKQIYFRLFYFLRFRYRKLIGFKYPFSKNSKSNNLVLIDSISSYESYHNGGFNFLNLSKSFDNIDWNFSEYGKLWTYNITYFDFLNQSNFQKEIGIKLIYDFIDKSDAIRDGFESFPISLRGINWIKFLTYSKIQNKKIDDSLYAQYDILIDSLEYHLLGNHLLENGFSLLFGAYYFEDDKLYLKAKEILSYELKEQILKDGGHFELSPMYHQIMLFRTLDSINLVENSSFKEDTLLNTLRTSAELMLSWLKNISYENGDIPLFSDSANNIAPNSKLLFDYAKSLELNVKEIELSDSGYRKILKDNYEMIVDVGSVGAEYIAGHAHADTFNFELQIEGKPFIVDSGLSTYEINNSRFFERGTSAHNTVEVLGKNSSEVWGGFRVANRARVIEIDEKKNLIKATHNGYKKDAVLHTRIWVFEDSKIIIEDKLSKETDAISRLHFHPDITEKMIEKHIISLEKFCIKSYKYADGFNKLIDAKYIEAKFNSKLILEVKI